MKSKIQNSIKFLKRFFEPASMDVSHTLITIFVIAITIFWNDVLPVVAVPKLLEYIQQGKTAEALQLSIFFCALLFALMAVRYFIRGPFWYSQRKIWGNLELKYRKLILKKDNLYFEKEGTGKVQSIVDNGIGTWAKFFNDMVWYLIESLAIVCVGIYFTSKLGYQFIGLYVVFVILAIALYAYMRTLKYKVDFAHRGIRNDFNARSVRSIMSRTEILLSGNADKESEVMHALKNEEYKYGITADKYGFWSFAPTEYITITLPFLTTIAYIYYFHKFNPVDIPLLVGFIYFSGRMTSMIWSIFKFVGSAMDALPDMVKFWNLIDKVPEIKNYEEGDRFVHRGGEIELKNISFSYEK